MALMASFGKRFGKKKLFKINEMPRMAQIVNQNGMAGFLASKKRKKQGERECKWNVKKPYRNVNQKVAKSAKRKTLRQFTHSNTTEHSYYIYIYYFYIYYYRVTDFHPLSSAFHSICCYSMLLRVNCFANVTVLYGHGEVMGGTLTDVTELFLPLFKCKQIGTV